jgi:SAM-dependent MidA family methyltransferase
MTPLHAKLVARIQTEGPITFAAFMEIALYDHQYGYYGSGRARIGSGGDFHTAVSVGPLFGALLARQFVQMWEQHGTPAKWTLVEQGAFDGQLALDVLSGLEAFAPVCFEATTLHLLEPLPLLQERQQEKLRRFRDRVLWYPDIVSLPPFCGVHYSNELLDAFPVHRLQLKDDGWREWRVATEGAALHWVETQIEDPAVQRAAERLGRREVGAFAEVCTGYAPHLCSVSAKIQSGWMLALDYGMSDAELALPIRRDGTLCAYSKQRRVEDLLGGPGEQDLTSHVNFSALALEARELGWTLDGYTEQHRFFTGLAPLHFRDATAPLTAEDQRTLLCFRTLTHPELMGFQFKAICLGRRIGRKSPNDGDAAGEDAPPLSGFGMARDPEALLFGARPSHA